MSVRILRCSLPGAWWQRHIGRVVTVLYTDKSGHWTRDTATKPDGYPFLQWVDPKDTTPTFAGKN